MFPKIEAGVHKWIYEGFRPSAFLSQMLDMACIAMKVAKIVYAYASKMKYVSMLRTLQRNSIYCAK